MKVEKVVFENSKSERLVGILHLPEEKTNRGFIIAHGFTSNKDRIRFIKIAQTLAEKGWVVLRFDFGGCGESQEREILVKSQVDDLKSAMKLMQKRGISWLGLIGESLGGLTTILAYEPDIVKTLVLLAPVTKAKRTLNENKYQQQFKKYGFAFFEKDGRKFKISKEYLEERLKVDQRRILSKIECPTLIVHGDADKIVPIEHSKEALQFLPKGSRLEVIKGANHRFEGKIEELVKVVVGWVGFVYIGVAERI